MDRIKIPALLKKNTCTQLERSQANESRIVTKTRWMVEARNAHIKCRFRSLDGVKSIKLIPYLRKDFQIVVTLINAFSHNLQSDKDNRQLSLQMLALRDVRNHLEKIVRRIPKRSFTPIINLSLFPKISMDQLKSIGLGSYQIKQAKSYCQQHLNEWGEFVVNVCDVEECRQKCAQFNTENANLLLILVNFKSRFQSARTHSSYVLFDTNAEGKDVVKAHCCSCKNGLRTVGCCSHVMTIIWYLYFIDHTKIPLPSFNLNYLF